MSILSELRNSDINASIATIDGAWAVKLGDEQNGYKAEATVGSEAAAYDWLEQHALEFYPDSMWAVIRKSALREKAPDEPGASGLASARADADTYD